MANTLRQVSSQTSCFFNQENGLITVGGNVGTGSVTVSADQQAVSVDLYRGFNKDVNKDGATTLANLINGSNRSTGSPGGSQIGFNDNAYNQRIAKMKTRAEELCTTCFLLILVLR
ncbi:MAG: hypothetical protein HC907_37770 [Richelia sp. SM1_7_0]|nr:hypothetical protein [Richelia sp. SM1_7_0]